MFTSLVPKIGVFVKRRKILVEKWKSGQAREVHIFIKNDQRGWAYVIGYNPRLFSKKDIKRFLKKKGIKIAKT